MLFGAMVSFDRIDDDECNRALVDWGHRMGPLHRPRYGEFGGAYGLRHHDKLVGVAAHEKLIAAQTCDLSRDEAFELARVCATRPDLCRVVLRLWREFVFPALCEVEGYRWAISYQDAALHTGGLYRHDGWVRLGASRSGPDDRGRDGKRKGRSKVIWGWSGDSAAMDAARKRERACE